MEYALFYYTFLKKARRPVRIDKQQLWSKKPKPGLHGQNDVTFAGHMKLLQAHSPVVTEIFLYYSMKCGP